LREKSSVKGAKFQVIVKMRETNNRFNLGGIMKAVVRKGSDFTLQKFIEMREEISGRYQSSSVFRLQQRVRHVEGRRRISNLEVDNDERGDVPGWVLVVLMTTGLVTAIWTIAAPRLSTILRNSLDAMNGIR